jgi:hypothetical protein
VVEILDIKAFEKYVLPKMSKNLTFAIFISYIKSEYEFTLIKKDDCPNELKLYHRQFKGEGVTIENNQKSIMKEIDKEQKA